MILVSGFNVYPNEIVKTVTTFSALNRDTEQAKGRQTRGEIAGNPSAGTSHLPIRRWHSAMKEYLPPAEAV